MPLGKPPHEKGEKRERDSQDRRAFNTPENAQKAVATSRACVSSLAPGRVWKHRTPHGEFELKGSLTLDNAAVVILHFNPVDGSLLPKGLRSISEGAPEVVSLIEARLKEIPLKISILDGAEFREPESCWAVPVAHQGRIVAHLKVSSDGISILPDKKAAEELDRDGP